MSVGGVYLSFGVCLSAPSIDLPRVRETRVPIRCGRDACTMSLHHTPILIVTSGFDQFLLDLQAALDGAGAQVMIASSEAKAVEYAERFEFSAVLIGAPIYFNKSFVDSLSGIPVVRYDCPDNVVALSKRWPAVRRNVAEVIRALEDAIRAA